MKPVSVVVVGAGSRGSGYASFAANNPSLARVVGVAEPRAAARQRLVQEHGLPSTHVFTDWRDLADAQRLADVAIVATQDHMHVEPTVALAGERGYHIALLEKPMAPDEDGCRRIVEAIRANGVYLGVAHVLRYTPYTRALKAALEAGLIGEIVSIQHLEPVGYWHQAHSYVRGNWEIANTPPAP